MPDQDTTAAAARLRAAADRFMTRVGRWEQPRWSRPVGPATGPSRTETRADRVHALVQRLADLSADTEREPRRPVPRLDNDLALIDQVRVLVADVLSADPPAEVLDAATEAITSVNLGPEPSRSP